METIYGDSADDLQYIESDPEAFSGSTAMSQDRVNLPSIRGFALSLSSGTIDGSSSNARLLMQMISQTPGLNKACCPSPKHWLLRLAAH